MSDTFNVVVSTSTNFDILNNVTSYTVVETQYPTSLPILIAYMAIIFFIIKWCVSLVKK